MTALLSENRSHNPSSIQLRLRWLLVLPPMLILLLANICTAQKPILRNVEVKGNMDFSEKEILNWLGLRQGSPYDLSKLRSNASQLIQKLREEGYYTAAIDSIETGLNEDSTEIDLALHIREGERTELGSITIQGNESITSEIILQQFDTGEGQPLVQSRLERDIQFLLRKYEDLGYPFARVEIESLGLYEDGSQSKLRLALHVSEGKRTTIDEVKVEGNKDTREEVILRELRISPGGVYSAEWATSAKKRLEKLNLFSSVSEPELYISPKGGGVLVRVEEGNSNSFDGILGYLPKSGTNPSGYFAGFVNFSMRNLFGTARRLVVRWQREDQETQEVEVRYLEPWVFSLPLNVDVGFVQREQDSSYVRRRVDLRGELLVTEEFSLGIIFGQERVIPSSNLSFSFVSESRTTTVGGEIRYDGRDDPLGPTSGVYYRSDYRIGKKKISGGGSIRSISSDESFLVKRLGVDLEFYFEPFARQVIGSGLHAKDLRSDHIEDADLYRFGGTNTLRGYRENQFLGSSIVWSNLEYRFLLARRSYVFGFLDTGYYSRPADLRQGIIAADAFRVGYGIGFRVDTSLGLLGVSYALGRGDTVSSGKIHFGIVNQF